MSDKMKLRCKIYPKYLDEILNGMKTMEYREIESIEFDDGKRKVLMEVIKVFDTGITNEEKIRKRYPDVPWKNKPMICIELGKILK